MTVEIREEENIKSPFGGELYSRYYLYLEGKFICSTCNSFADIATNSTNELLVMAARELWGLVISNRQGVLKSLNDTAKTKVHGKVVYKSNIEDEKLYKQWADYKISEKLEEIQTDFE